jgi:phosphoserine phosphatase
MARRFDLIAFDVDGTLVDDTVFVWATLHDYFHTDKDSCRAAFEAFMAGRWNYRQWFEHDIELLVRAGADRDSIHRALADMRLMEGAEETLCALRAAGMKLAVISGSLNIVLRKFDLERHFDEVYLNHLHFDEAGNLVRWVPTSFDVWDKATGLRDIATRHGIPMERTAFVGDNFNDVAVAKAAGFSIAFNCKSDELAKVAGAVVPGRDLRAVLPHLVGA